MQLDWVEYTSATGGTGALTLANATGLPGVESYLGATGTRWVGYVIVEAATGKYEAGIGALNLATKVLARTVVRSTWSGTALTTVGAVALSFATTGVRVLCAPVASLDPLWAFSVSSAPGDVQGVPPPHLATLTGATAVVAGTEYYVPYEWPGGVISTVGCYVTTAVAGGLGKWAVYDILSTGLPGAMLINGNAATFNCATTGNKTATAGVFMPRQLYYVGLIFSSATIAVRTATNGRSSVLGVSGGIPILGVTHVGAYATGMPDPAAAAAGLTAVTSAIPVPYLDPG